MKISRARRTYERDRLNFFREHGSIDAFASRTSRYEDPENYENKTVFNDGSEWHEVFRTYVNEDGDEICKITYWNSDNEEKKFFIE